MTTDRPHDQKRQRGPFVGCLAVAVVLLPALYVLSVGPAIWLHHHGYLTDSAAIIYVPLGYLHESWKPIGDAMDWYMDLWR